MTIAEIGQVLTCSGYDNSIRWSQGDRLEHIFEDRVDHLVRSGRGGHLAVETETSSMSYVELEQRANQTAHYLISIGVRPGDSVGLLFNKSADAYVAMLGVLKAGAAYVPFDGSFPVDRIAYIVEDAGVSTILTMGQYAEKTAGLVDVVTYLDDDWVLVARQPEHRCVIDFGSEVRPALSYVIYTSGTTGKPKGVAIEHPSIHNFVNVAADCYEVNGDDRMYQGMTLAFDFSVEEIWIAFAAGATLIPAPQGAPLVGEDLARFLRDREVTALACVPTLLATIERDLPRLRFLLLSGEACPADLARRWYRPDRRIINAYGPTEATVTATWLVLDEFGSVTIGGPLPTYSSVILDPDTNKLVEPGAIGEIGIGGIGLALGYLNRPDLTESVFIPDFVGLDHNPSGRIYRTGDLGRFTSDGEIEFLGRIDTQVKIRGYRIEVTEVESVLLRLPQIAQVVVDAYQPASGVTELVGFYTKNDGALAPSNAELSDVLKASLPSYMIPSIIQELDEIPTSTSGKADRGALPEPTGPRLVDESGTYLAPKSLVESVLCESLAATLGVDRVSADADFFYDLGAYSLLLAQFCSSVREGQHGIDLAMTDLYQHPNVVDLAEYLADSTNEGALRLESPGDYVPSKFAYYRTGCLQALTAVVGLAAGIAVGLRLLVWLAASTGPVQFYLRSLVSSLSFFVLFTVVSIVGKWLVVGRFVPESIPIWSMRYYRFWLARSLIRSSPMRVFRHLPIFNLYLRAIGVKVGKRVIFNAGAVPVCADLVSIGDDTILRADSDVSGYRVEGNYIVTGRVDIGQRVTVGEGSVVEIATSIGDDATLAHASCLHSLQEIPKGENWHGSPARPGPEPATSPAPQLLTTRRKVTFSAFAFINRMFVIAPLAITVLYLVISGDGLARLNLGLGGGVVATFVASALLFGFGIVASGLVVIVGPRLLHGFVRPGRSYVLYGFNYSVATLIIGLGNSKFLNHLFGDSAFITRYQQALGWDLGTVEQTGSNFGILTRQDISLLCSIGNGTMVSDGVHMMNMRMSSTSMTVDRVGIGEQSFLGNSIRVPYGNTVGSNCLLATKVMVPTSGPIRHDVGLLGSPAFEIPRQTTLADTVDLTATRSSSDRATGGAVSGTGGSLEERVAAKTRYNVRSIGWFLLSRYLFLSIGLAGLHWALSTWKSSTWSAVAAVMVIGPLIVAVSLIIERSVWGFGSMKPRDCTIHDRYYWKVERYWKLVNSPIGTLFAGTPLKNTISRLGGVKVGSMVFDDGATMTEKTLVTVGAGASLSQGALLQSHSLEDGEFKSDLVQVDDGASIGRGAFIHYGTQVGANVVVDADSFLMKGESAPAGTWWRGNPARLTVEQSKLAAVEAVAVGHAGAAHVDAAHTDLGLIDESDIDISAVDGRVVDGGAIDDRAIDVSLIDLRMIAEHQDAGAEVSGSSYSGALQDLAVLGLGSRVSPHELTNARRLVLSELSATPENEQRRRAVNAAYAALRSKPSW